MGPGNLKLLVLLFAPVLFFTTSYSQRSKDEKHIRVAMRMIGHEILLLSGDSTSRVLPIEKEAKSYKIRFESDLQFNPGKLASTVNRIIKQAEIAKSYFVEMKHCITGEVIYSYEMDTEKPGLIPCGTRMPPKGCYVLFFTVLKKSNSFASRYARPIRRNETPAFAKPVLYTLIFAALAALLVLAFYFLKKKNSGSPSKNPDILFIGGHRFDKKSMLLTYLGESMQLSGKETDLLLLLCAHENQTLQRDQILRLVWEDEGDYIGRTLDVFISKLRKKLEADPRVKIMNIRGVGYKLVVIEA